MIKEKISNLIAASEIEEALQYLFALTESNDSEIYNHLLLLSAQMNADKRKNSAGALSYEELRISENANIQSILQCLNQITDKGYLNNETLESLSEKIKTKKADTAKTKILFIASNPIGTPDFNLEKEYLNIRKIFNSKRGIFEVTEVFDTTLDDLFEATQREKPQILHISAPSTGDVLDLHHEDNTRNCVPYEFLASAFLLFKNYTNCVFINTLCSAIFLKKVSKKLGYSIGFNGMTYDEICITFSSGFYTALAQGKNIEEAFLIGVELLKSDSNKMAKEGIENLLLFKNGYCLNKEDTFPESFLHEHPSEAPPKKQTK